MGIESCLPGNQHERSRSRAAPTGRTGASRSGRREPRPPPSLPSPPPEGVAGAVRGWRVVTLDLKRLASIWEWRFRLGLAGQRRWLPESQLLATTKGDGEARRRGNGAGWCRLRGSGQGAGVRPTEVRRGAALQVTATGKWWPGAALSGVCAAACCLSSRSGVFGVDPVLCFGSLRVLGCMSACACWRCLEMYSGRGWGVVCCV